MSTTTHRLVAALGPALAAGVLVVGFGPHVRAAPVGSLPTFASGQPIRASDFNSAFSTLRTAIDDNNTRIGNLTTLNTTAKGDLVSAINEVRQTAGTGQTGPQGPQGPAGPTKIHIVSSTATPAGGGTNQWTGGTNLTIQVTPPVRATLVAGRPFTAFLRVQTNNPAGAAGQDNPGNPLVAGNLVIDLVWTYAVGAIGSTAAGATQGQTTIVIDAAQVNNKTATITGTVPNAPNTAGGATTTHLALVNARVNAATTAQGQAWTSLDVEVTPP